MLKGKATKNTAIFFDNESIRIYFADISFVEHLKDRSGSSNGLWVITKHTNYNFEKDMFDNPCFIAERSKIEFIEQWHKYKKEKEEPTHAIDKACEVYGGGK